jgi:Caspase domain
MAARSALVVATADYEDRRLRRLRAPAADADSLARVLRDPAIGAFEVEVLLDETEGKITRRLSRFFLRDRHPDDTLLLHLSCHGIKSEDGRLYFAVKDTDKDDLDATAIAAEWLRGLMDRSRSRRIVMTLDCCFSGAFGRGLLARGSEAADTSEVLGGRGRAILTATDAVEYALEGDQVVGEGTPSIFTSAVVDGLKSGSADRDGDGWVSVDDLYEHVFETVRASTSNMTPRKWILDLQGPALRIARSTRGTQSERPDELALLVRSPAADIRYAAVEVLSERLRGQDPQVATRARSALRTLAADPSGRVSRAASTALGNERLAHRIGGAPRELRALAISPDWRLACISGSAPMGTFGPGLWDLTTGRLQENSPRLPGMAPLAFSPDGALLALRAERGVLLVDPATGEQRAAIPAGTRRLVFAADGRLAATWHDATIQLWTLPDCREHAALTAEEAATVTALAFVPGAEVVATLTATEAFLWETRQGRLLGRLAHGEHVTALAASPEGRLIGLAGGNVVSLWEVATRRELSRLHHDELVTALAFDPQGRTLTVGAGTGRTIGKPLLVGHLGRLLMTTR